MSIWCWKCLWSSLLCLVLGYLGVAAVGVGGGGTGWAVCVWALAFCVVGLGWSGGVPEAEEERMEWRWDGEALSLPGWACRKWEDVGRCCLCLMLWMACLAHLCVGVSVWVCGLCGTLKLRLCGSKEWRIR